ncbi:hypothetical protein ACWGLG_11840 [Streptomyces antimycoticus]
MALDADFRATLAQWLVFPAGAYLMGNGRHDDDLARMQEALGLYDKLIGEQPGSEELRYRKAWALVNLAQALWDKPDHAKAHSVPSRPPTCSVNSPPRTAGGFAEGWATG